VGQEDRAGSFAAAKSRISAFHDLRHTFASRLAMEGVDPARDQELGGWKSLSMVQRYAHLSPSHDARQLSALSLAGDWEPAKATGAE